MLRPGRPTRKRNLRIRRRPRKSLDETSTTKTLKRSSVGPIGPPLSLSFAAKMLFILLAGLNVFLFYTTGLKRLVDRVEAGHDAPLGAKISAAVSLFLWVGVMYWGRMLQFFGKSF